MFLSISICSYDAEATRLTGSICLTGISYAIDLNNSPYFLLPYQMPGFRFQPQAVQSGMRNRYKNYLPWHLRSCN